MEKMFTVTANSPGNDWLAGAYEAFLNRPEMQAQTAPVLARAQEEVLDKFAGWGDHQDAGMFDQYKGYGGDNPEAAF